MSLRVSLLTVYTVLVFEAMASANAPKQISIQGRLTDAGGAPLPADNKDFTFMIFDSKLGGALLWTEDQPLPNDAAGLWSASLGAVTPLTDVIFQDTVRWLEIEVDGTLLPRVRLVTGPYAYRVATLDGASGGTISSKVSIGPGHTNTGTDAFVAGAVGVASGNYSSIGGGLQNTASGANSSVSGGFDNAASAPNANVGGGTSNTASGTFATVGGGYNNQAIQIGTTVSGGEANFADANYATIGGGKGNSATGIGATVAGGGSTTTGNGALGDYSSIGGGFANSASDHHSTIGGGTQNTASGYGSAIGGGTENVSSGEYSVIGGGTGHASTGVNSVVGGGFGCAATGSYSGVNSGLANIATGTGSTIGGGGYNKARGLYSTIAGGGGTGFADSNSASASYSTVGGGTRNHGTGVSSTIGGGTDNECSGLNSTVGGGAGNASGGPSSTVAGGDGNVADGDYAMVPGGLNNEASGNYSFAAGRRARALNAGCFVWADRTDANFSSTDPDQFLIRAAGGVGIGVNSPFAALHIDPGPNGNSLYFSAGAQDIVWHSSQPLQLGQWDGAVFTERMRVSSGGNIGINTTTTPNILTLPDIAGVDGRGLANAWSVYSSRRWKDSVHTITSALEKVSRLRGVTYVHKSDGKLDMGLIAEEVGDVIPEVVQYEANGVDAQSVDYARLVALLIEGMKEQQRRIIDLELQVRKLAQ